MLPNSFASCFSEPRTTPYPRSEALAADERIRIPLVVSQPDRPAGRGRQLTPPAVKHAAIELDLPVYQPESLRTEPIDRLIADASAIFLSWQRLARSSVRNCWHFREWDRSICMRRCCPTFAEQRPDCRRHSRREFPHGRHLMGMESGLDTGPILAQRSIDIERSDTTASLKPRLAQPRRPALDRFDRRADRWSVACGTTGRRTGNAHPPDGQSRWLDPLVPTGNRYRAPDPCNVGLAPRMDHAGRVTDSNSPGYCAAWAQRSSTGRGNISS